MRISIPAFIVGTLAVHFPVMTMAESLLAARNLRSQTVITSADLQISNGVVPGALSDPQQAIGMETLVTIYSGRPIMAQDLAAPAIVERNQIVALHYHHAGLAIVTEARSMDRGSVGDRISVMNLSSRSTVTGVVMVDGSVNVAP